MDSINFISEQPRKSHFSAGNLALIGLGAVVLAVFASLQGQIAFSSFRGSWSVAPLTSLMNNKAAVLGASTYNKELVAKFSDIAILTIDDNSPYAIRNYNEQVNVVRQNDGLNYILDGNINQDLELAQRGMKFISDLKMIAAPSSLADYHKLLLAYYGMKFMQNVGSDNSEIAALLPAVQEQLDSMQK